MAIFRNPSKILFFLLKKKDFGPDCFNHITDATMNNHWKLQKKLSNFSIFGRNVNFFSQILHL